jgi:hypothetical protein
MEYYQNLSIKNINGEIWKDIDGFENQYQISSFGRVKSLPREIKILGGNGGSYFINGKIRKQTLNSGYCVIGLDKNGKKKSLKVHILVAMSFIPNPENKKTVNHKGNKRDNRSTKLEWSTQSENNIDSYKRGIKMPSRQKKTIQMDKDGNLIKVWDSCRLAARELKIKAQNISLAALSGIKVCGGFKWKYYDYNKSSIESLENEIWKPIDGFENLYEVSNLGRVKSLIKNILLSQNKGSGYCRVSLTKNKKSKSKLVHRLVAKSFIPNPENKKFINHINGIKDDNRVSELEWSTSSENNKHAVGFKNIRFGMDSGSNKLTDDNVIEIRKISDKLSSRKIAKIFNVNKSAILNIINNKSWIHVQ